MPNAVMFVPILFTILLLSSEYVAMATDQSPHRLLFSASFASESSGGAEDRWRLPDEDDIVGNGAVWNDCRVDRPRSGSNGMSRP